MSTKRFGDRGYVTIGKLPKGPDGRALCRQCQTQVPVGRRSFCSDSCVDTWKLRTNPSLQAAFLIDRDHGVCQLCQINCIELLIELTKLRTDERIEHHGEQARWWGSSLSLNFKLVRFVQRCDELGLPKHLRHLDRRLWEADHIVPVSEGGGDCGPENLRTLCWKCHRSETAALKKRLSATRKKSTDSMG